jgi:hypothetical protein
MNAAEYIVLLVVLLFYFRFFEFQFFAKRGPLSPPPPSLLAASVDRELYELLHNAKPEDVGIELLDWKVAATKAVVVLIPIYLYPWIKDHGKITLVLAYLGAALLLGPATIPYGSQLKRASPPTFSKRMVWKLMQRVIYTPWEKLHAFLTLLLIAGAVSFLRWTTGWQTPIDQYIPRGPWIHITFGKEQPSLINDSVWISMICVLFIKSFVSAARAGPNFFAGWWHVSTRLIVGFYSLSIFLEYTGLLAVQGEHLPFLEGKHLGLAWLLAILFRS